MDASHFVIGSDFLGSIYGRVRRFVRTFSGRQRYNVLGAINIVTKKVTTITVMDNARYQKCNAVKEMAATLGIDLVYIPPYSPNLNPIERLWKFVKGKLRSKYYDDFKEFSSTIDTIIKDTEGRYKQQIESLIGEKIQLFDDLIPLTENTFIRQEASNQAAA